MSASAPSILPPGVPQTAWAQARASPPHAFFTLFAPHSYLQHTAEGSRSLAPGCHSIGPSFLHHSACTASRGPWCVPLLDWRDARVPKMLSSPALLMAPLRWFKCLWGPWLDHPSKGASTAQGIHLNGGAEPGVLVWELRLGQLQERKAESFCLGGLLSTGTGSEKKNPVRTEPALGSQGLLGLLLLLWAEGFCPQEIKLVLRGWHYYSNPYRLQGGHTRGEQRGLCAPSKKRGKTMMGVPFRPR